MSDPAQKIPHPADNIPTDKRDKWRRWEPKTERGRTRCQGFHGQALFGKTKAPQEALLHGDITRHPHRSSTIASLSTIAVVCPRSRRWSHSESLPTLLKWNSTTSPRCQKHYCLVHSVRQTLRCSQTPTGMALGAWRLKAVIKLLLFVLRYTGSLKKSTLFLCSSESRCTHLSRVTGNATESSSVIVNWPPFSLSHAAPSM